MGLLGAEALRPFYLSPGTLDPELCDSNYFSLVGVRVESPAPSVYLSQWRTQLSAGVSPPFNHPLPSPRPPCSRLITQS